MRRFLIWIMFWLCHHMFALGCESWVADFGDGGVHRSHAGRLHRHRIPWLHPTIIILCIIITRFLFSLSRHWGFDRSGTFLGTATTYRLFLFFRLFLRLIHLFNNRLLSPCRHWITLWIRLFRIFLLWLIFRVVLVRISSCNQIFIILSIFIAGFSRFFIRFSIRYIISVLATMGPWLPTPRWNSRLLLLHST